MRYVYQIELKEFGFSVRFWGQIVAGDALAAINRVIPPNVYPYQEWIARRLRPAVAGDVSRFE